MVYFISDTHFYHQNIIKYCKRPFNDIKKMNETIINNWNSIVADNDTIYHLGDFCLAQDEDIKEIFNRLNGNKILIRGNHDRKPIKFYEELGFKVLINAPIVLEEYKLLLSHVPLPNSKIKMGYLNLHGHIHNKKLSDEYPKNIYSENNHLNVSVDVTNFKPVSLDDIIIKRSR